jgi:putative membrane protein
MMNRNKSDGPKDNSAKTTTDLARERNREAADRKLMAWIRTSIALIGFGFGINKLYQYIAIVSKHANLDEIKFTVILGGAFMALGTLGLLGAILQYRITLKSIKSNNYDYTPTVPLTEILAVCLLLVGMFAVTEFLLKIE